MSLFYEGGAGAGKTTSVVLKLTRALELAPLSDQQRVLALTFMHGARQRLDQRLSPIAALRRQYECMTIDAFAWRLLHRWRTLATTLVPDTPTHLATLQFDEICSTAGALLLRQQVSQWVARAFPIIVVDEAQDCRGSRTNILRGLSSASTLFAAADAFQDLSGSTENEAVSWLNANLERVRLDGCHRTQESGLLATAQALRTGITCPADNTAALTILGFPKAAMALPKIATEMRFHVPMVILSPVGPDKSTFVREILSGLEKPIPVKKLNQTLGPFKIRQEQSIVEIEKKATLSLLPGLDDNAVIDIASLRAAPSSSAGAIIEWADRRAKYLGEVYFSVRDIRLQITKATRQERAYARSSHRRYRSMSIHQAKNQEFPHVIVLWPYEVVGNPELQRRLLYNAITRATTRALIIVQNNPSKSDRLKKPPFTST